eukprot:scaffold39221_cov48-Phaeocystis_antarctica.AAC.1
MSSQAPRAAQAWQAGRRRSCSRTARSTHRRPPRSPHALDRRTPLRRRGAGWCTAPRRHRRSTQRRLPRLYHHARPPPQAGRAPVRQRDHVPRDACAMLTTPPRHSLTHLVARDLVASRLAASPAERDVVQPPLHHLEARGWPRGLGGAPCTQRLPPRSLTQAVDGTRTEGDGASRGQAGGGGGDATTGRGGGGAGKEKHDHGGGGCAIAVRLAGCRLAGGCRLTGCRLAGGCRLDGGLQLVPREG